MLEYSSPNGVTLRNGELPVFSNGDYGPEYFISFYQYCRRLRLKN
jgi:hypothetical protein